MYLYNIVNQINQKEYIGITNNYKKRWSNHRCCNSPNMVIAKAIKKYGVENFSFNILERGLSLEEANEIEIATIAERGTLVPNGYNVSKGGGLVTFEPKYGEDNNRALLTNEQAYYIKSHRDIPEYVLYDDFSEIVSYKTFMKVYRDFTYPNIKPTVDMYPYNLEFSCQFISSKIDYGDVVELREKLRDGVYWREAYEDYKDLYPNEWSFWAIYIGRKFELVMPEVLTEENKRIQASLARVGDKNGRAKLVDSEVLAIRDLFRKGRSREEILELYPHCTRPSLNALLRGETWKHLL